MTTKRIARIRPVFRGEWASNRAYEDLDAVLHGDSTYVALKSVPAGTLPTDTEYWQLMASGISGGDFAILAGTGLTGGGNLSANLTISLATSHYPIGVDQTWQDVKEQRAFDTTYTNTTGRPILVSVGDLRDINGPISLELLVDEVLVDSSTVPGPVKKSVTVSGLVPPGSSYKVIGDGGLPDTKRWLELR